MAVKKEAKFNQQQITFLSAYFDPESITFNNAKQSAIKAGYSEEYASVMTTRDLKWMSDYVSQDEKVIKRKRMLDKAEKRLEASIDCIDPRVALDASKFIAKTIGKDEGYTERNELTGKDGKDLMPTAEIKEQVNNKIDEYLNAFQRNTKKRK